MNKRYKTELGKKSFERAGWALLRKVRQAEKRDLSDTLDSWQEIEARLKKPRVTFRGGYVRRAVSIAASVAVLLSVGVCYWMESGKESSLSLALLQDDVFSLTENEVVLIENENRIQLEDESSIRYDTRGKSNVEENIVGRDIIEERKEKGEEINQIIVPKGKRVDITFSDGTRMYVNADTRVFYPAVFKKDKREIVVEGEVYLDVVKDPSRPFIVKANGFDVKVLGTQFNVCAYKGDASASVVLVNGRVEVSSGENGRSILSPNQMIEINEKGTNVKNVDVFEYICWKDNMMMLNDRKVGETLDRLSRYYGRKILYDEEIGNIPISGKLDLRKNMEDVINIVCQSLYLRYKTDAENNIIISK